MLDWFFKEIWSFRRTKMLRNMSNFINMFSDDEKALNFIKKYIDTYKWFEFNNVYLKRPEERAALSIFKVNERKKDDKSVIILDWLNSHQIADSLNQKNVHFFDFSRETDQSLTKEHMQEIIFALEESNEELLKEWLWDEFDKYLFIY